MYFFIVCHRVDVDKYGAYIVTHITTFEEQITLPIDAILSVCNEYEYDVCKDTGLVYRKNALLINRSM